MKYTHVLKSDIGMRRKSNQDSAGAFPEIGLFLVADGMGGHRGGEVASQLAVDLIAAEVRKNRELPDSKPGSLIEQALIEANIQIYQKSQAEAALTGMGTTTVVLYFAGDQLTIGNVGDSRCYFFRNGAIWQLTRDHSIIQEKIKAGLISRLEAKSDELRNVITRSVGFEPQVIVDIYNMKPEVNDLWLLCSDGLSSQLDDVEILKIIDEKVIVQGDLAGAATALVDHANQKGGDDNVSVLLVQCQDSQV